MDTVKSADGTIIAYEKTGDGPALVVSVGAFCTRATFMPPEALTAKFTVCTYDRRGRGDSGDTLPYRPEREYEDLAAVCAAVCAAAGEPHPYVFGHSSGAAIALRAAGTGVIAPAAIVAYEAPFANEDTPPAPDDPAGHIRDLVAADRRDEAVLYWMRDIIHLPAPVVAGMRGQPWVRELEPLTPTLPYDIAITDGGIPFAELARIHVPVLVLGGSNSPAWFRRSVADQASAIPGATLATIDGYDHNAPPEILSPVMTQFYLNT